MKKRFLTMLLALVMVFSLFPTTALAGWGYGAGKHSTGKRETKTHAVEWKGSKETGGLKVKVTGADISKEIGLSVEMLGEDEAAQYFAAIKGAGRTLVNPIALNITLLKYGEEYQPTSAVQLSITRSGVTLSDTVYHFEDAKEEADEEVQPSVKAVPDRRGSKSSVGDDDVSGDVYEIDEDTDASVVPALKFEPLTSSTSGETATVTTDHFSVYVISEEEEVVTPRATYHFLNELATDGTAEPFTFVNKAGDLVDYQIVKGAELLEDPGAPVVGLEKNFLGWFVVEKNGNTYSFPTNGTPIDFSQTPPVQATTTTGDIDVYVAPRFGQAFIVTFWDNADTAPADQLHIVAKKVVYLDEGEEYTSVNVVDSINVPSAATQSHSGWYSLDYKENETTTYTLLEMPVWQEVTGNCNLYPTFSDGHWLRFAGGPSGSGAGYRQAIFVTDSTPASAVTNLGTVARDGYTFAGWYYKGSEENPFDGAEAATDENGNALNAADLLSRVQNGTGDLTLYGHWTGNATSYKVISWFENADDDKYSFGYTGFEGLQTFPANSGDTTNYTAPEVEGFTAQDFEQQTVVGDGSTTLNVYYKRNIYEVRFFASASYQSTNDTTGDLYGRTGNGYSGYTYYPLALFNNAWYLLTQERTGNPNTSNNTTYLAQVNGSWVQVRYNNSRQWQYRTSTNGSWTNMSTAPSVYYSSSSYGNGTRYKLVNGDEFTEYKISAKYGADIHDQWPGGPWYIRPDNTNEFAISITTMPLNGANYYQMSSSGSWLDTVYMTQTVNGGNNFEEYQHNTYQGSTRNSKTAGDYTAIKGFRLNAASQSDVNQIKAAEGGDPDAVYEPNYNRSAAIGTSYSQGTQVQRNGRTYYTLYFYYLRNQYKIEFDTRINGTTPDAPDMTGVYYEANIATAKATEIATLNSNWKVGETTVYVNGFGDMIFQGWYDNEDCEGEPFNFNTTMPASDIVLYAKWDKQEYLVQIDPRGGEIRPEVAEVTYTWLKYGDHLREYNIRRDFVEAPDGYTGVKYYYVNILASDDPNAWADSGAYWSGNRKGFYAKEADLASLDAFVAAYPSYAGDYAQSNYELLMAHKSDVVYMPATTNDNWAFVGWYKATVDPETHVVTDTNELYTFSDDIVGPTAIYAKWRRSGLFTVQYHGDNGPVHGSMNGSVVLTDSSYADAARTKVAYTPDTITSTDGKRYVFVGWKLAAPHGFDATAPGSATLVGDLYVQGDEFTVDAEYADIGHFIHLVAVYEEAEINPDTLHVTQVVFNPNFPTDATGQVGEVVTTEGVPLNTAINLSQATFSFDTLNDAGETVTKTGNVPQNYATAEYILIGWNNVKADADAGTVKFKLTDVIGIDSEDPADNTLYAVWEAKVFYVFHSYDCSVEKIAFNTLTDGKFDITSKVKGDCLYGGYYSDYSRKGSYDTANPKEYGANAIPGAAGYTGGKGYWVKGNAYKEEIGTAMTPEANKTYFLKEVPKTYLATKVLWGYDWRNQYNVTDIYALTVVDDACYSSFGYEVGADNTTMPARFSGSFSYQNRGSNTVTKYTPADLGCTSGGYIGAVNLRSIIASIPTENGGIAIQPFWVTLDGVEVTTAGGTFACSDGETLTKDNFGFTLAP